MNLNALLEAMSKVNASDLHLKVNAVPIMRVTGVLRSVEHPLLSNEEIKAALGTIMPVRLTEVFGTEGAVDFAHTIPDVGRFRVAAFHQRGAVSVAIRRINPIIPRLSDLNLPKPVNEIIKQSRGLTLVTGVTGSGKSTTLAALLNEINLTRREHIVTLEDPIEYIFEDKMCIVNQMEIGVDCSSFKASMQHVIRFDPDIVLIGEMRNSETVSAAIEAADTGHMVVSTLHTSDAKQTINRVLHFFPKEDEDLVLEQLALNMKAIISQRLVPRSDVKGLIPCVELLINVPIVSKLIREGRIEELQQVLAGRDEGMQSFDVSLALLVTAKKISLETATKYCSDEASVRRMIRGEFSAGDTGGLIGGSGF